MTTVYKPIEFVIEGLIAQGLYILAGALKVGKSWLSVNICLSIAKGEKVFGHETKCGTALYLCLEDSFERIQKRLYQLTDEPTGNLHFAIMSDLIGNGLQKQITDFKSNHTDLKVVFIDTLKMIRESTKNSYGSDCKEHDKQTYEQTRKMLESRKKSNVRASNGRAIHQYCGLIKYAECGAILIAKRRQWRATEWVEYTCNSHHSKKSNSTKKEFQYCKIRLKKL